MNTEKFQFTQEQQERIAHALLDICQVTITDQDEIAGRGEDTPSGRIRGEIAKGLAEILICEDGEMERDRVIGLAHTLNSLVELLENACTADILHRATLIDPKHGFGKYRSKEEAEHTARPFLAQAHAERVAARTSAVV